MTVARGRKTDHWQTASSWLSEFRAHLVRFASDQTGNVFLMFGLAVIPLMVAIGGAADVGRWVHASNQTVAAMDAAVLRGGRALQTNPDDPAAAIAAAEKFYKENVTNRLKLKSDSVAFTVSDDGTSIIATGKAFIETPFLSLASIDQLPLLNESEATVAVGGNGGENLEISVMLDVTGSMWGEKIADLQAAAKDLIDIVVWDDQSEYTAKVALAPFSDAVRPGREYLNKVRGSHPSSNRFKNNQGRWSDYRLTDCVSERGGNGAYTDIAPEGNDKLGPVYTRDGSCNPASDVMPLTTNKYRLKAHIDELNATGWTAGHLGTAWAWYLLSPNWGYIWPDSAPASYDDTDVKKIAILMTDGEYNQQYDAAGVAIRESGRGGGGKNGLSDSQARRICDNMKEAGITVYTVGFDLREGKAMETMRLCASTSRHVYLAENGEELRQAFRDIALKLTTLYLSK